MRTTLEIDDRVLAAARGRARARRITVGQAISELALKGYEAEELGAAVDRNFPMLPAVPGHVITDAMVEDALDEDR